MWLNYSRIKEDIDLRDTANTTLAKALGIANSTLKDRLAKQNLTPDNVFGIAIYFKRDIRYYFDLPEANISEEPEIKYNACSKCAEKQKKLNEANDMILQKDNELIEYQRKYIELLEKLNNVTGNRSCG